MKAGTTDNPKFRHLVRDFKKPLYVVVGILESIWAFTKKNAPQGDIGKWTDEEICDAIEWDGPIDQLIDVLVDRKWLDRCPVHRLVVHAWEEHADNTVKRVLANKGLGFVKAHIEGETDTPENRTENHTDNRTVGPTKPCLTKPCLTKPYQKGAPPLRGQEGVDLPPCVAWSTGELPPDLIEACAELQPTSEASTFHKQTAEMLLSLGFDVKSEVPVPNRGDGRKGRVDLVALREATVLVVECDCISAREKSIRKVLALREHLHLPPEQPGLVLVRDPPQVIQVPIPETLDTAAFREDWKEYLAWRERQRKPRWDAEVQADQLQQLALIGEERARAAIVHSRASGYNSIFEVRGAMERPKKKSNRPAGYYPDEREATT